MTGIICINKDKDITSFGVVSKVRGITREKKAGHTGTLDPMATGVLPIMLGGATRFLDYLPDSDKGYRAKFVLGKVTDTYDITGKVTEEFDVNVSYADVESVLDEFRGTILQLPPMYSAVSVGGKRLYDLARKGIDVEREARQVDIKKLELVGFSDGEYTIDVLCSKGTYIRSLIYDIGQRLNCGATMTALERTLAMGFTLDDCVSIDEIQKRKDENIGFDDILYDIEKLLESYECVYVSDAQARRFSNGGALSIERLKKNIADRLYRVYSREGMLLGLGKGDLEKNELAVARLLVRRD